MNVYRFAGLGVQIESVFPEVHQLCKEYRFDGIPCFAIKTDTTDIEDACEEENGQNGMRCDIIVYQP